MNTKIIIIVVIIALAAIGGVYAVLFSPVQNGNIFTEETSTETGKHFTLELDDGLGVKATP